MSIIDDWVDAFRVVLFIISLYSCVLLHLQWMYDRKNWDKYEAERWYALAMWSLAGCVFTAQGVFLDRPFTPGTVFLAMAIIVTAKMKHEKLADYLWEKRHNES